MEHKIFVAIYGLVYLIGRQIETPMQKYILAGNSCR